MPTAISRQTRRFEFFFCPLQAVHICRKFLKEMAQPCDHSIGHSLLTLEQIQSGTLRTTVRPTAV
eukprot:m.254669 g.254669  ORF g.254669 m.254669 type:complete len:65 (+) comp19149_c0_seq3:65-259(+)